MDQTLKVICTICARGGSQGIKNKNLLDLCGKPLIAHTIHQAQRSGLCDTIVVSSDSAEILAVAKQYGVHYLIKRPDELALATSAKLPAIQHAVAQTELGLNKQFDVVLDLDVTSPLRSVVDMQESLQLFQHSKAKNLIT